MKHGLLLRWIKCEVVGTLGTILQLAVLAGLREWLGLGVTVAAALAVEAAILHNFFWHRQWTWRVEGDARRKPAARQFLEYNLSACLVTAIGNVMLTGIYVERLHVHYLVANLMAIVSVGVVNFLIGECLVFRPGPPEEKKEASVCRASVLSSAPALLPPSA